MFNKTQKLAAFAALATAGTASFAVGPDLTALSAAVQVDTIIAAILSVAGVMISVKLVQVAIRYVKGSVR